MKFKEPHMEAQYRDRPEKLREICAYFVELSRQCGVEPVVTRVTDAVKGESGVHPQGRAVDFRDEFADGKYLYKPTQVEWIVSQINDLYRRKDGKPTCLHHKVSGSRAHFHIQSAVSDEMYV